MENFAAVNFAAVAAGAVVSFFVGWLWYSPKVFGRNWAIGSGISPEPPEKMPVFAMLAQLVSLLILALVIGLTATTNALITALLAILAVAVFTVSTGAWINKNAYAMTVDFFYVIVAGVVMIGAQALL